MKKQRKKKRHILLTLLCILIVAIIVATAAAVIYILPYSRATMDLSLLTLAEEGTPAVLYAPDGDSRGGDGKLTYHPMDERLPTDLRRQVVLARDEIPDDLIHAFVAIEDKRFYEHEGVDLIRTLHAVWNYATQGGDASFGGSTITQQLVKNLTGYTDRTPDRKLTEIFSALDLERQVDKDTILTVYLNIINLGGGCVGVGAAAEDYFGKSASELTLTECAAIAAITQNPTRYNPRTHPEENERRRGVILSEMRKQGYITEAAYHTAVSTPLTLCGVTKDPAPVTSWYAEMVASDVLRDLQTRLGYTYEKAALLLSRGGLIIETTVDEELQAILTDYYGQAANFPTGTNGRPQSSAIIIDPYSGDILAVAGAVGAKDAYYLQNYATSTKRPAGSAIKPLGVYAPALKEGLITWGSVYEDAPTLEKQGRPWPKNADGLYRGRVTVRDAVAHSLNTVPVEIVNTMGLEKNFDFLRDTLHMDSLVPASESSANDMTLSSVALGQQHGGVTVRELTAAYTIFTDGLYRAPVSYRRVLDGEGRVLLENKPSGERVLTAAEASLMTRLLETVTEDGTACGLSLKDDRGIPVAGKTGTTQNNCDRWFVGYTPNLLCGVWMGYDYPVPLDGIDGNPCLTVFDEVMSACEAAYESGGRADFDRDPLVVPLRICPLTGEIATPECYAALTEKNLPKTGWFIEGTEPRDACHLHFGGWQEAPSLETETETDGSSKPWEDTSEGQTEPWWFSRLLPRW